jgi:hypothetical protein
VHGHRRVRARGSGGRTNGQKLASSTQSVGGLPRRCQAVCAGDKDGDRYCCTAIGRIVAICRASGEDLGAIMRGCLGVRALQPGRHRPGEPSEGRFAGRAYAMAAHRLGSGAQRARPLFAALNVTTGKIMTAHKNRRRRIEFHERDRRRSPGHRNLHLTPTRASSLNPVEIWFLIYHIQEGPMAPTSRRSEIRKLFRDFLIAALVLAGIGAAVSLGPIGFELISMR